MNDWRVVFGVAVLLLSGVAVSAEQNVSKSAASSRFEFALVGDFPYSTLEQEMAPRLIADVNAIDNLAWVLHVGDIRGRDFDDCS